MTEFVKLYGSILDSTVWLEALPTKVVWITMLAMADWEGFVSAAVPTLAKRAGVSRNECEVALEVLGAPDMDSKTKDFEGRRIEKVEGGWKILNHGKYRDMRTETQVKTAQRVARYRQKHKKGALPVTDVTPSNGVKRQVRADIDTDTTKATTKPSAKYPHFPMGESKRLFEKWVQSGRGVDFPTFRKALAPFYLEAGPVFSEREITDAIVAFGEVAGSQPPQYSGAWSIHKMAGDLATWVRLGKMPKQYQTGELTERGRLIAV